MEISFCIDNKKELKKFLNEASSVAFSRNKIIKRKKGRHFNHNRKTLGFTMGLLLITMGLIITFISNICSQSITETITERSTIFLMVVFAFWLILINNIKKTNKEQMKLLNQKGALIINSEQIKMNYIEREISTSMDKAIAVIVGKYSINIVTNNNIIFNTPIITKDKVVNTITKYKKDISIIELK